ncbi:hypothetical protein ACUXJ9_002427 [Staphylococcus caledonicus]
MTKITRIKIKTFCNYMIGVSVIALALFIIFYF